MLYKKINQEFKYDKIRFENAIGTSNTFMSNFYQLSNPIIDEYNNTFWNSEGYYMAQRTSNLEYKKDIAKLSELCGKSSKSAKYKYELDQDVYNRVFYMINAVTKKFEANKDLLIKLIEIDKEIIEKNYWNDTLFGVNDKTLIGANILGKILMKTKTKIKI